MKNYVYQPKINDHGNAIKNRVANLNRKTEICKSALVRKALEIGLNELEKSSGIVNGNAM